MAINLNGVDDVLHCIARIFEPLLRLLWPAQGCHRPMESHPAASPADVYPTLDPRPEPVLRGEDSPLVRPYLVAHEQREEARLRRARRRALWLAVHGIDIGPRLIHGIEVSA
ncbi:MULTISPECIES: hypothetical protein [unclassified Streptomyces]|uniref:hypothetical protein n=1 Tax=unclassified Streptomyces TaxID=2593676 RepID=UPI000FAB5F44|nr:MULTISPECIES: hypothetical protein [unclassified Streptomyces]MCX4396515.1 hypothetical protein [Streptomyces sp. NBC_01767]RPK74190.1 hypothetical protein EES42_08775 [Streptomyces sp. ADI95-17]WSG50932.1 hypothetical protein OHA38_14645 [Streptomyces sp. NBC_01732]